MHLEVYVLLSVSDLVKHAFGFVFTFNFPLVISGTALKFFNVCLDLSLLSRHFLHLEVKLLDCFFHLLALLKEGILPSNQL